MDTNELLSLAAAGHEAAILELRQQFLPLLYKAANQPHLRPIYAEALSEAEISFLLAIRSYNPDRGIPFPGYAKAMVYGSLRTLFKQERRRWQRELYPAAPADGLSFWDTLPEPQNAMQEYIDNNPQEALQPWIRLMDVYRMAGMRDEFERVASNLNQHFNVEVQNWSAPES